MLPGTGGLTRVTDKRKVRRDHADVFCTTEEGIKGKRAVDWRLVDEVVPNSQARSRRSPSARRNSPRHRPPQRRGKGIALTPLERSIDDDGVDYGFVSVDIDRAARLATITIRGAAERRRRPTSTA